MPMLPTAAFVQCLCNHTDCNGSNGAVQSLLHSALEAVDAIEGLLKAGGVPYVHCWGGRGRSGLIAACLLGKAYGLGADQALERVSRSYQTRERGVREGVFCSITSL